LLFIFLFVLFGYILPNWMYLPNLINTIKQDNASTSVHHWAYFSLYSYLLFLQSWDLLKRYGWSFIYNVILNVHILIKKRRASKAIYLVWIGVWKIVYWGTNFIIMFISLWWSGLSFVVFIKQSVQYIQFMRWIRVKSCKLIYKLWQRHYFVFNQNSDTYLFIFIFVLLHL